jgi:isopenicillin N synthase-like dioxygenase
VVNPPGDGAKHSRFSVPFFLHPNPEFMIETLATCVTEDNPNRYPESISSNDYLTERLIEIGLIK